MAAARRIPHTTPYPWDTRPVVAAIPTDAASMIIYLYRHDVRLTTDGAQLLLDAPKDVLSDAVMAAVEAHLDEIARYAVLVGELGQTTCATCGGRDLYYLIDQADRHLRCERCQPKALLEPAPATMAPRGPGPTTGGRG